MFTKDQFRVLLMLHNQQCTNKVKSFTITQLAIECHLHPNTIRIAMKTFKEQGYIAEGARQRSAKSYFITNKGIKRIKELEK